MHERSKIGVLNMQVYLTVFLRVLVAHADFLAPFPTATVAEEHEDILTLRGYSLRQFAVQDFHTAAHLFV